MKKIILIGLGFLSAGFVFAQSAASSRNVGVDTTNATEIAQKEALQQQEEEMAAEASYELTTHRSQIAVPEEIWMLLDHGRTSEAEVKFRDFQNTLKKEDKLQILLMQEEFYTRAMSNPTSKTKYEAQRKEVMNQLRQTYKDDVRVMRYELDDARYDYRRIIKIATKMIEKDSTFLPAYQERGDAYFQLGEMKNFCEDFNKLPTRIAGRVSAYTQCKEILRAAEEESSEQE